MHPDAYDWEYGGAAEDVVDWLVGAGFLREGDCSMNVACGRGGFASPMCRTVRVLVCMDVDRGALETAGQRCAGGCRTELFERDWNTYVPARGKYDSCVISPSHLCFSGESVRRIETVSRRGCAVVFPQEFDYRRIRKAFLQSLGVGSGFVGMPSYPDSRPFSIWLSEAGRGFEARRFETRVECPEEVFMDALVTDSVQRGADADRARRLAEGFVSGLSRGGAVSYRFSANVVAWDVLEG